MASSIHIANGTSSMGIHNTRVFAPDYLIVADKSVNEYKSFTDKHINDLVEMAKSDYKAHQKNNRSLPKNATLIKEAIVNLESHHSMNDLELLKSTLEKEYGYLISNISIHKDEGYIYTDKINYTMGREQYKNQEETPHIAELDIKDNKFYEWHKINNEWTKGKEISEYEIKFNYHAHIEILNYDFKTHRTIRNNLKAMSKMQTLVAESLGMQRGKCSSTVEAKRIGVEVQESRKRMNIKDYKNYKRKENELKSELSKVKEENKDLKYNFKEMQKTITALETLTTEQKKELHQLNSQVKNGKAEVEQLHERIKNLKVDLLEEEAEVKELVAQINHLKANPVKVEVIKEVEKVVHIEDTTKIKQLKAENLDLLTLNQSLQADKSMLQNQNKALKTQNLSLNDKILDLTNEINSKPIMSDYEPKYKSLMTDIKKFNEDLEAKQTTPKGVFDWVKSQFTALKEQLKALKDQVMALGNQQLRLVHLLKVQANQTATLDQQMEIQMLITGKTKDELVKEAQKAQEPKERRITMEDLKQLNEDMKKEREKLQSKSKGYEL